MSLGDLVSMASRGLGGLGGTRRPAVPDRPASPPSPDHPSPPEVRGECLAAALVDRESEVVLTQGAEGDAAVEAEALANSAVLEAALKAAQWLSPDDEVVEIRASMTSRVHHIRPIDPEGTMFLYVALEKSEGQFFDHARKRIELVETSFGI